MGIRDFLTGILQSSKTEIASGRDVMEAVDRVAGLSDPKLRWVSNYRKKLKPAVAEALEYLAALVRKIPEPVILSREMWGRSPLVTSFFSTGDEIDAVFRSNRDIQRLFEQSAATRIYALLTMTRKEKQVFGIEQQGDLIKRDVPQVAVHFYDHRIIAPSIDKENTRQELIQRALEMLATEALSQTTALQTYKTELESQQHVLSLKLRLQQSRGHRIEDFVGASGDNEQTLAEAEELLTDIDHKLAEMRSQLNSPDDYLRQVNEVLINAGDYLKIEPVDLKLNSMGIKVSGQASNSGHDIQFCEITFKGHPPRAAVLICYSKDNPADHATTRCMPIRHPKPGRHHSSDGD